MVGSRCYSVSSTCSGDSGNYSAYSPADSEKLSNATNKLILYSPESEEAADEEEVGAGAVEETAMLTQADRPWPSRVMCRCCLAEKLEPKMRQPQETSSSSEPELEEEEEAPLLVFVPLDTLAMVDLNEDKSTSSPSTGYTSGDSYKVNASARTAAAASRGGRRSGITTATTKTIKVKKVQNTLLDCLNACARIGASAEDIELPQHICLDCCHTLEMCCEFIRCVRNADKILRRRCAVPLKRSSQQQQQQQQEALLVGRGVHVEEEGEEESPAAKRRRRREEKLQQEHRLSVVTAGLAEKKCINNTPKSISFSGAASSIAVAAAAAAAVAATTARTSAEKDQLLDTTSPSLDGSESNLMRSIDSGIEIDEDLSSVKSSDASSANENSLHYHLAKYEGYTYVVAETLSHDLERFHRSERRQAGSAGGAATTYKCGFCIFECTVRQELNKHLQIHLGAPQHSCRKCNFAGHFKFLLAHHMRNAHHCTSQEVTGGAAATESPTYHCHLCEECFVNYDGLQQHRKSHKVFCKCPMCKFKSSTRENVLEHLAKEHKVLVERHLMVKYIPLQRTNVEQLQELSPTKNHIQSTYSNLIPKDKKYRTHLCQFCGKCFDRRFHLLKHEYSVHREEIEQTNSVDDQTQRKISTTITSTKHSKLKYLRQRNVLQEARQQRCVEELEQLDNRQAGKDITSKFKCVICSAVFMFNFELKYHMRTHKTGPDVQSGRLGWNKEPAENRRKTSTPKPATKSAKSLAADVVESEIKLSAVIAKEYAAAAEQCMEEAEASADVGEWNAAVVGGEPVHYYYHHNGIVDVFAEVVDGHTMDDLPEFMEPEVTDVIEASLPALTGGDVELDLLALVVPQTSSPLESSVASPSSSTNSFDVNYDDQLYLNDFDLGLLDCSGGFEGF